MQYHALPCNTMLYNAVPCNTMQYHAIPCNTRQYHAIPCYTMQHQASPYETMQLITKPFNIMQCHAILCIIMQYLEVCVVPSITIKDKRPHLLLKDCIRAKNTFSSADANRMSNCCCCDKH